ncbi:hypothetical protein [Sagittula sp. S175]|uniref:hypothetical protein n=1 Tax=Sagittula sp. S175 TaxID=3415129 RepID=UPI003C7A8932
MKKVLACAVGCAPALLPDALSLGMQFSYWGAALSGVLLAVALVHYKPWRNTEDPQAEKGLEVVGVLSLAFVVSVAFTVYQLGAKKTVTAELAPELAAAFAKVAGTQDELRDMIAAADERTQAVQRVVELEAQLNTAERALAANERNAQERERELQAEFRAKVQEMQAHMAEDEEEALNEVLLLLSPGNFNTYLRDALPGYINKNDVELIQKWTEATAADLDASAGPITASTFMARPRPVDFALRLGTSDGVELWHHEDSFSVEDLISEGTDAWTAETVVGAVALSAETLQTGDYFFCMTVTDRDTGDKWTAWTVETFELETKEIEVRDTVINTLPRSWTHSHTADARPYKAALDAFCGA